MEPLIFRTVIEMGTRAIQPGVEVDIRIDYNDAGKAISATTTFFGWVYRITDANLVRLRLPTNFTESQRILSAMRDLDLCFIVEDFGFGEPARK